MTTLIKLGPADHGRKMSLEEFLASDAQEGYQYELIDGKLYVSPEPNMPYSIVEEWLGLKLSLYLHENPTVVNWLSHNARVYVPNREDVTNPEPDIALYKDLPLRQPLRDFRWQDHHPLLVVEILTPDDPDKDLVRNVEVYFQVPQIKEYWIIDAREETEQFPMTVRRRYGKRWRIIEVAAGTIYSTNLLPDFELKLDVHS